MGIFGDAFNEGSKKAKASSKKKWAKKATQLNELRSARASLESKNQLSRDLRSEKGKLREAKLESFGMGKERRKKFATGVKNIANSNSRRFRKRRGGGGNFKKIDIF